MRVHVHPAGRDQEAGGVDLAPAWSRFTADFHDALAFDRHVTRKGRLAGPIDNGAAAYDDVVHGSLSWLASEQR
jgi:hypothetical protein